MPNKLTAELSRQATLNSGKPVTVTNRDILNSIRDNAGEKYQNDIPVMAAKPISHDSVPYSAYQVHQNEFFNILINRIMTTVYRGLAWQNPLSMFRKENFDYGETVQEIYVGLAEADDYDGKSNRNPYDITDTPITVFYHDLNYEKVFRRTIDRAWTQKAFVSERGFDEFVDKMLATLLTSDQLTEFEYVKRLITKSLTPVQAAIGGVTKTILSPVTEIDRTQDDWLSTLNKELINRTNLFTIPSTTRFENGAGVPNSTAIEDQYFITCSELSSEVDSMLANAFNMSKVDILARKIVIDDLEEYTGAGEWNGYKPLCALVSKDTFIMVEKLLEMNNLFNPETLGFNYWLHHHQLISYSLIENSRVYVEKVE